MLDARPSRAIPTSVETMLRTILPLAFLVVAIPVAVAEDVQSDVFLHELDSGGYHIAPDQLTVNVGQSVKLTVHNAGTIQHDLWVCGDGESFASDCDDIWGATPEIPPNGTAVVSFTAKKAGTFQYYCHIPGHKPAGMLGTLHVQGEAGGKPSPSTAVLGSLMAMGAVALSLRSRRS
jgi:uncharacterized cupredoxin-like copper-binding protein